VDAIAGLLTLRERHAFSLYATDRTHEVLDANPIFEVLARDVVTRRRMTVGTKIMLALPDGAPSGLTLELFAVPGKIPLYLETPGEAPPIIEGEETVGAAIHSGPHVLHFIPGCARMTDALTHRLRRSDLVLFDGTLWADDEMQRAGLGSKTGQRMGHMSVSGENGTLAAFRGLPIGRKILLHINNSNPILLDDSPERAEAAAAGWEVAYDGMELQL
jgi:pyrroloquinoline quinone biosynthesis protein B